MLTAPPLSLYIHIPWCVQKCPYCDFNSHGVKSDIPEAEYIQHLLNDLAIDAKRVEGRTIETIFFGGGTPSLFSPEGIHAILQGVQQHLPLAKDAEITMEANPGTIESGRFAGFQQAGVNRISVGVQSFQTNHLLILGRIHDSQQAIQAIQQAGNVGLNSFNIDLMHGLPKQDAHLALDDLQQAIALNAPHLSWYQLTIEPNTLFHSKPPTLPPDDTLWDIQEQGQALLAKAGYEQYEISGYSKPGHQCRHNLNYWRFGDYIGIGCGAHGKITNAETGTITRTVKIKHPKGYMDCSNNYLDESWLVEKEDRPFEFFMNQFRLFEACPKQRYEHTTGLSSSAPELLNIIEQAQQKGWLIDTPTHWETTDLGKRFLNELLELFL
ncbi:radical SAM family heme chaperone HemW [Paraneptunicella aestuarii]|uniref:radical SAM family heme chaperone HemW n=1 Tax=Paraneptunicella aestuarii TaxID=2831148 RepID=UPI001E457572|nr:radical SAM family heme chaperone HemW [Paraneptunicella aestuarii]UAA37971.1 radical SAM family heme chaperone HemW [Paraneptunicella aestuarii]